MTMKQDLTNLPAAPQTVPRTTPTVFLPPFRIGLGDDTHRIDHAADYITLGGLRIPCGFGLVGHSDADVLLHAITDALLGAAALGDGFRDIGEIFPDTDPANQDRDSAEMLRIVSEQVRRASWQIGNLDCIVHAQQPKLQPHRTQIQERVAAILNIQREQVSIKAKTGEHVGPVGRLEAITATAVVLLVRGIY
ncbi:MAG: 2-C-methyl-D-erythritol 2,4-cyclodiphosphate synthase [Thermoguttaceae bacterium]|nr:2-C-methyl-D-erythritol 2,4-cyclodiphosphate synthase [Thermoguttaceae bacterium]